MPLRKTFCILLGLFFLLPTLARAEYSRVETALQEEGAPAPKHELTEAERRSLARQFLTRISKGLAEADRILKREGENDLQSLPDGEELLFRISLPKRIILDTPLLARVEKGTLLISLTDFIGAVDFPITVDPKAGTAKGWYIRENKGFNLDMAKREVTTDNGTFILSSHVTADENDIYIPAEELGLWFAFKMQPSVASLELKVEPSMPLPIQDRVARRDRDPGKQRLEPPSLPQVENTAKMIDYPFIDVSTRSQYEKEADREESDRRNSASVLTRGDFAYGTLSTNTQLDQEDKLTNLRVNYEKQSLDPELLGPLKARRYEVGDVSTVLMPVNDGGAQELGMRVTNAHPLRSFMRPSTEVSGVSFPGWDIELYRDNQLVGFQTVGDDGVYRFPDVDLFSSDNNFRLVLYGPQGEVREEELYIPVDPRRLSDMGSAYDISLTQQDTNTYRKEANSTEDEDEGAPRLRALYEMPFGDSSALSLGMETKQRDGNQLGSLQGGVSTKFIGTLFNLDAAVDSENEMAAELVARRDFGEHQFRNEIDIATDRYNLEKVSEYFNPDGTINENYNNPDTLQERFSVNGPVPMGIGSRPRYNLTLDYTERADDSTSTIATAGFSTTWRGFTANQQMDYRKNSVGGDDVESDLAEDEIHSLTTLSGNIGRNRLRLFSDYEIKPENSLDRVTATYQRYLKRDLELEVGVERQMQDKLTEARTRLNWRAGFANISPGISYNTDKDFTATLNTRFGVARDPQTGKTRMFDRSITSSGGVSAFVFLDKDGDGQFNNEDEPLPDVVVQAPQNGGRALTDKDGVAFFARMGELRLTDVFVDEDSLQDPFWIAGYKGASVLPREGHVKELQFPILISGEMDGTVYVRDETGEVVRPLRGVTLALYNASGAKVQSVRSEADGFYLFSKIPPGAYYLSVDDGVSKDGHMGRPSLQPVNIGYDGTTLYGNNIYIQEAMPDVPVMILSDLSSYSNETAKLKGRTLVLNLGSYNSQLMMSLVWFKIRTAYEDLIRDAELLEKPSHSYPSLSNNQYSLRLSLSGNDIEAARKRCAAFVLHGLSCRVEILPGGLQQKMADAAPINLLQKQ